MKKKRTFLYLTMSLSALAMLFPYVWMILMSMKSRREFFDGRFWPDSLNLTNLIRVFTETQMATYLYNSLKVTIIVILTQLFTATLAAYALATIKKPWVKLCFALIMVTYMVPAAVTYIPSYVIISDLNLLDTHLGYILSESISIFSIFFLYQVFRQVPKDVVDAARLDGAGHLRLIYNVYVPFSKNALASLVIITFIYSYNNYMWPSLLIRTAENMFVTLGLRRLFMSQAAYGTDLPLAMAACTVSLLPLFILLALANKRIIQSMANLYVNK